MLNRKTFKQFRLDTKLGNLSIVLNVMSVFIFVKRNKDTTSRQNCTVIELKFFIL